MLRFLREQGARWLLLLAVLELCTLIGSLLLAMQLRYLYQPEDLIAFSVWLELRATVFAAVIVASMAALGMYQPNLRENWLGMLARQGIGFAGGGAAVALVFYLIPQLYIGRTVIGIALAISFPLVAVGRWFYLRVIDIHALKRRVMVLGSGSRAEMIITRMRRRVDRRGFFVGDDGLSSARQAALVGADAAVVDAGDAVGELADAVAIQDALLGREAGLDRGVDLLVHHPAELLAMPARHGELHQAQADHMVRVERQVHRVEGEGKPGIAGGGGTGNRRRPTGAGCECPAACG